MVLGVPKREKKVFLVHGCSLSLSLIMYVWKIEIIDFVCKVPLWVILLLCQKKLNMIKESYFLVYAFL